MARVMFAEVCDVCKTRGPEYDSSFVGFDEDCGRDVCKACTARIVREREQSADEVMCVECAAQRGPC